MVSVSSPSADAHREDAGLSVLSLYMFRQIAQAFLILVAVLTGLVWVSQAIRMLNLVVEKGRSLGEFLTLTGFLVPWIAGLVAPTALFVATVYVLHRINSDSELVVIHAAGGSKWRLLRPFALSAAIVTGLVVFVNLYAMPHGMRAFREKLIEVRTDLIATLVQEGQFVSPEQGLTVHIRAQDANGDLLGLLFHDTRQPEGEFTYLAERARLLSGAGGSSLLMFDGTLQRRRGSPEEVDVVRFEEYTLDLSNFGPSREVPYYEASEKYMSELLNPDPEDPIFLSSPGKLVAEAHDRLSSPLYAMAMMLIGFIGMSSPQSNRAGRIWVVLAVSGLALGLRVAGATTVNLVVKQNELVPLTYLLPAAGILASLVWLWWNGRGPRGFTAALAAQGRRRQVPARGSGAPARVQPTETVHSSAPRPVRPDPRLESPHGPPRAAGRPAGATRADGGRAQQPGPQPMPDPDAALRRLAEAARMPRRPAHAGPEPAPEARGAPDGPAGRPPRPPLPSMVIRQEQARRDDDPDRVRRPFPAGRRSR